MNGADSVFLPVTVKIQVKFGIFLLIEILIVVNRRPFVMVIA